MPLDPKRDIHRAVGTPSATYVQCSVRAHAHAHAHAHTQSRTRTHAYTCARAHARARARVQLKHTPEQRMLLAFEQLRLTGATITADGTAEFPITFTSILDLDGTLEMSVNDDDVTALQGLWGGLVILGNAPIQVCHSV